MGRGGGAESSSRLKGEQGGGRVEGMGVWYGYRCGSVLISCVCGSVWTGGWVEGDVGWRWGQVKGGGEPGGLEGQHLV